MCPNLPSLLAGPIKYNQYPHIANIGLCWPANTGALVYRRPSLMSSHLLLQQCLACLVRLRWFVRWKVGCHTVVVLCSVASRICPRQHVGFLCSSHQTCRIDTATTWKKSRFNLSERSNIHVLENLSIVFHAFTRHMSISLLEDEMLLPMYINVFTNFRGLSHKVEMALV